MDKVRIQIITPRGDGCFVDISATDDCVGLRVEMVSQTGNPVDEATIEKGELFDWIESRQGSPERATKRNDQSCNETRADR